MLYLTVSKRLPKQTIIRSLLHRLGDRQVPNNKLKLIKNEKSNYYAVVEKKKKESMLIVEPGFSILVSLQMTKIQLILKDA